MRPRRDTGLRRHRRAHTRRALRLGGLLISLACALASARAQGTFSSGSTGADGAFAPTANQTIQVPPSGVFNYTTVNIPGNVTITYTRNARNTPVIILASGNVSITGSINASGEDGKVHGGGFGGPGGFNGGAGGFSTGVSGEVTPGLNGDGPGGGFGGGTASGGGPGGGAGYVVAGGSATGGGSPGLGGPTYGLTTLVPLVGGSGGGGGSGATNNGNGGGGGGGGGALLIASSGTITFTCCGLLEARGGHGRNVGYPSGGGSGGAIRLIANTIAGTVTISVVGGNGVSNGWTAGSGSRGFIRIEAYDSSNFTPNISGAKVTTTTPQPVFPPAAPTLRVASVGGVAAPAAPGGSLSGPPDVVVPTSQPNPVTVALEASNLPLGTLVEVTLTPENGARTTVQSGALGGTVASSTANASLSLSNGISVIRASAVVDLSTASTKPLFIDGERVLRMEVAATFGGASEITYITQSGRRIKKVD